MKWKVILSLFKWSDTMNYLCIDIGTTNIKAVLYHKFQNKWETTLKINTNYEDVYATQDPEEIYQLLLSILKQNPYKDNLEIVLSTPMHTLILLDEEKKAISRLMIWSDQRSKDITNSLSLETKEVWRKWSGTPVHSMNPVTKILWCNASSVPYSYISDLKAYLMYRLLGRWISDASSISASGLWDKEIKSYHLGILHSLNLTEEMLPEIVEINSKFVSSLGFNICIGSSDGVLANIGLVGKENDLVMSIGTSIGIRKLQPHYTNTLNTFSYYAGKYGWLNGTASNNGGNLLEYISHTLDPDLDYINFIQYLDKPLPTVMACPYAYGERGPWYKENLKVVFSDENALPEEKIHVLLLGMIANIKLMIESLENEDKVIYISGNFIKNKTLQQMIANVLDSELRFLEEENAVCMGLLSIASTIDQSYAYSSIHPAPNPKLDAFISNNITFIKKTVDSM